MGGMSLCVFLTLTLPDRLSRPGPETVATNGRDTLSIRLKIFGVRLTKLAARSAWVPPLDSTKYPNRVAEPCYPLLRSCFIILHCPEDKSVHQ